MPDPRHLLFDIVDRFVWPAFGGVFGGGSDLSARYRLGRQRRSAEYAVRRSGWQVAGWPLRCGLAGGSSV